MTYMFKSKIEQETVCRKCKSLFKSVDGSPCPKCSEENKKLAAKREANKKAKLEASLKDQEKDQGDPGQDQGS